MLQEVYDTVAIKAVAPLPLENPQPTPTVTQAVQSPDIPRETSREVVETVEAHPSTSEPTGPAIRAIMPAVQPSPTAVSKARESAMDAETSTIAPAFQDPAQERAVAEPGQDSETASSIEEATLGDTAVRPAAAVNIDFGWLAQTLWERVSALKHYPYTARRDHLEGQVVLRVVIAEDGGLMDVQVLESSGHAVLDQDALDVMRRVSSLKLTKLLGRPQVVVHVPISYRLLR